jgi:Rad3-related DNA helicase
MGLRDVLVVDEGHFIDEVIVQVSAFEIKPWMLNYLRIPEIKTIEQLKEFVVQALARAINLNGQLEAQFDLDGHVTIENVRVRNAYKDLIQKSEIFLNEDKEEWIWETKFATIQGKVMPYLHVTPLTAQLFGGLLWRKSTGITIVSSATLLNPRTFMIETGLNQNYNRDEILYLEGPCIFPKENRPVVDMTVGNLSYKNLEANLEKACIQLEYILAAEPGNVAVHIPSYELVDKIIAMMRHIGSKHISRFITHESTDRNDKMLEWTNNRGNVFFAVAFTEGYDWKGDICDAQVLFKVPYPNIKDKRIARMLELKRWNSYYTKTLTTVIQSYGRAIRSETDKKRFYVIDSSFWNLIKRNGNIVPEWFLEVLPKTAKV